MNTQVILNCLKSINDNLKDMSTIVDRHNFDSELERLTYKEQIDDQMEKVARAIKDITKGTCKQCKFNKSCESKTNLYSSDGCDKYEQSVLVSCEKCACKDVCYYHRDIVSGTKYEDEYFGENVECPNYIERLD